MSDLVKYGEWDDEQAAVDKAEAEADGGTPFVKLQVGRNVVRFLPPKVGVRTPFKVVWTHFLRVHGRDKPIPLACPRRESSELCPICDKGFKLRETGNEVDFKESKKWLPRKRVYANVIDRSDPSGIKVLGVGKQVHDQLISIRHDKEDGGNFTNPTEDGFDIVINRKGTGQMDTEYTVRVARDFTPLHDDAAQANEWIEAQFDLSPFGKTHPAAKLRDLMDGNFGGSNGSAPEAATSQPDAAPAQLPKGRRRSAQDDVIDADYEEASS
jgi:hypothetical protein